LRIIIGKKGCFMTLTVLIIPFIGAFISWLMIYLPLKLLFYPFEPLDLGLFRLQGYIPKNREKIALAIADYVMKAINPEEMLRKKLDEIDFKTELDPLLDTQLDKLVITLKQQIPMAAMFLSPSLILKLKGLAKDEIIKMIPTLKEKLAGKVLEHLDIKELISEQLNAKTFEFIGKYIDEKGLYWSIMAAIGGYIAGMIQIILFWYLMA
jgi:uncharacterized membrane protein YheB (UPF0754 family)